MRRHKAKRDRVGPELRMLDLGHAAGVRAVVDNVLNAYSHTRLRCLKREWLWMLL